MTMLLRPTLLHGTILVMYSCVSLTSVRELLTSDTSAVSSRILVNATKITLFMEELSVRAPRDKTACHDRGVTNRSCGRVGLAGKNCITTASSKVNLAATLSNSAVKESMIRAAVLT